MDERTTATEASNDEPGMPGSPILSDSSSILTRHDSRPHTYERVPATDQPEERAYGSVSGASSTIVPDTPKPKRKKAYDTGTLDRSPFHWWFNVPMDVLLALTPLLFLVIASMCLALNNSPVSKYGEDVKAVTLLSPTVFPIIYAAVLGKMLRRVALYKAERSATIGTIERLIGCQSLFSTFERQFAFRRVDILGLSILLAWLLSPLGGQSSLRLLTTQPLLIPVQDTITYFPIEGYGLQSHIYNTNFVSIAWPLFAPLFMSALLTSKQYLHAPMDQFGNLNIPDIFQLEGFSRDSPPDTWIDIPKDTEVGYTSLIGIPIVGLPPTGNTSFELVSHYWSIECEALATKEILKNETLTWITSFDMTINYDTEFGAFGDSRDSKNRTKFAYQTRYITSQVYQQHANLTTYRLVDGRVASAACWAFPLVVESRVICQGRSCAVLAIRRLGRDTEKIIDKLETSTFWFQGIADSMPRADQSNLNGNTDASALVEHWMMDPNLSTFRWDRTSQVASSPGRISKRWVELSKLPSDLFNRRLQVAVNTYWQSALGSAIIMGNFTKSQAEDLKDGYDYTWNTTELTGTREDGEKYICNVKFAIITIAISLLLLAAAFASLVLGIFTKAPDTLGFVSTSARDNPYVTTQVASHLDGLEAARALQDMRIRIGDVNSTGDIGHVAFASMDAEPKRVSRKRLYN